MSIKYGDLNGQFIVTFMSVYRVVFLRKPCKYKAFCYMTLSAVHFQSFYDTFVILQIILQTCVPDYFHAFRELFIKIPLHVIWTHIKCLQN